MRTGKAVVVGRSDAAELLLRVAWFYYKDDPSWAKLVRNSAGAGDLDGAMQFGAR